MRTKASSLADFGAVYRRDYPRLLRFAVATLGDVEREKGHREPAFRLADGTPPDDEPRVNIRKLVGLTSEGEIVACLVLRGEVTRDSACA